MLHDIVKKGSTNRSVTIRIIDETTGVPENGVEHTTTGLALWYRRELAAKSTITPVALEALTTAHTDGGIELIGDGYYRLDLPDAAFATGAQHVDFGGTADGMIVIGGRVRLVDYDPEDAVRAGLTALPNAAAEGAGGLYTRGTGAGQINQTTNGQVTVDAVQVGTETPEDAADLVAALFVAVVEGTITFQQSQAIQNAAAAGLLSGAETTLVALRNLANTIDRIVATVDDPGNRTAVAFDFTDL